MEQRPTLRLNCGCTGCLSVIAFWFVVLWAMFHISEIVRFVTG